MQPMVLFRRLAKKDRMKKVYPLILLAFIVSPILAQKTTFQFSGVNKLDVFGPFEVELIKSDKEYAEIDLNGIEKEDVVYEANRGELRLKLKNRHYINEWKNDRHSRYILVKMHYKDIDIIDASAGAVVKSNEQIKSKYLSVKCTMGAEVTLDIYAKKIIAETKMGGELEMTGQTEDLKVDANTGGVLKAAHLESKFVYVRASMGAEVIVNATEELEASAGFGALVDYVGGPTVRHTSRNFGGEVNRRSH
jgi:hypothetical protein